MHLRTRTTLCLIAAAAVLLTTGGVFAHGDHHGPHASRDQPWWMLWNLRPSVLLVLGLLTFMYLRGVHILWRSAGDGHGVSNRQRWIFLVAIGALLLALVSPIEVIAEELNSVHMVQHMLLIKVAAPLLVLASTGQAMVWSLPQRWRGGVASSGRFLRGLGFRRYVLWQPLLTWASFALVLWLLHVPELYHAALRNRVLHDLQHVAFLVSACIFWRVLLDPISSLRLSPGLGVLYLFTTMLHASALGVFMAFSPGLWYSDYAATTELWNVQPLIDQQVAGYIMWMPACVLYAAAAATIFGYWLAEPDPKNRVKP